MSEHERTLSELEQWVRDQLFERFQQRMWTEKAPEPPDPRAGV